MDTVTTTAELELKRVIAAPRETSFAPGPRPRL